MAMQKERRPTFTRDGYETHHGFRIRKRGSGYQVDLGRASGRHVRVQKRTQDEAVEYARLKRVEVQNKGLHALSLSDGPL